MSRTDGDEGNTHVEFALQDRTPADNAAGVLMAPEWLAHCDRMRFVRIRSRLYAWSDGARIVVSCDGLLERPRRGRRR